MIRWLYFKYGLSVILNGIVTTVSLGYFNTYEVTINAAKAISRYRHKHNYFGR